MDRKAVEITKFLLDWNYLLINAPVSGSITEIYFCFILSNYSKGKDRVSWQQFIKYLNMLNKVAHGHVLDCTPHNALQLTYEDPFKCFNRINYINRLSLSLILKRSKQLTHSENWGMEEPVKRSSLSSDIPTDKAGQYKYLMTLIEGSDHSLKKKWRSTEVTSERIVNNSKLVPLDGDDIYSMTSRSGRLIQLELLLRSECASHHLIRERARLQTSEREFYDCCENPDHANQLSQMTEFDRQVNYCKLKKSAWFGRNSLLAKCVNERMHFIPVIQQQTDTKLGDCSYLDTCHKMESCRYVHYGLLMPQSLQGYPEKSPNDKLQKAGLKVKQFTRINNFTRGEPVCLSSMEELPPQWINCDVTKLNFDVLGNNWGVIIADPSWTIHMNLNYSSMKDDDLLSLRMDKLQKEGIYLLWVTGRTIEMGRKFLKKWGYRVLNQITWIKTSQLVRTISTGRTGHWLNHSKEHLLVGVKGEPKWMNCGVDPQILISSTRETSRKPEEIYGIVERMVGLRVKKLEIFGRQHNTRPGWLTIGNQLQETHLVEKEISIKYSQWLKSNVK
ncbi:hypothetical protein FOA43_003348 [Brettanomyces nanus]|uniref:mRNA m(6)A methyltransferase n=1 Tax=Eeniella nana TaxID=13502 RepID=A0A875S7R0_EENNA|nr:uncharacterized protein FOA43_003348 [Brettanomyces nanus]QPG75962.1 hypothetical protein FOA43_003348 [Brettanomyces nanus]